MKYFQSYVIQDKFIFNNFSVTLEDFFTYDVGQLTKRSINIFSVLSIVNVLLLALSETLTDFLQSPAVFAGFPHVLHVSDLAGS